MSANFNVRTGVIAAMGVSGLLLSACASSHHKSYPGEVYAYESGGSDCGVSTVHQPVTVSPRYSSGCDATAVIAPPAPALPDVVYADCGTITNMGCNYDAYESAPGHSGYSGSTTTHHGTTGYTGGYSSGSTGYSSGSSGYSSGSTYSSDTVSVCPTGSYMQADGTCTLGSSGSSYTSTTTTSTYTPSTTTSYSSGTVECPAGTTLQGDGTCMQSSGSSYSSGSSSSYTSSTTTSYSQPVTCPSGTVMQGDGSCMSTGYSSSSSYTADDYLPIRK